MMPKVSHHQLSDNSIVEDDAPLPISPFIPSNANLFSKMPDCLDEAAWETWFFDGVSSDGKNGLAIGSSEEARKKEQCSVCMYFVPAIMMDCTYISCIMTGK